APLPVVANVLGDRAWGSSLFFGGSDDAHVLEPLAARRSVGHVEVAVGELTAAVLRALPEVDVAYAAASPETQRFVADAVAGTGVTCQVALERPLTCATGLCHG